MRIPFGLDYNLGFPESTELFIQNSVYRYFFTNTNFIDFGSIPRVEKMAMTICPECGKEYENVLNHIENDHDTFENAIRIPTIKEMSRQSKMKLLWRGITNMVGQLSKSEKKQLSELDEKLIGYGLNQIAVGILSPLFEKKMSRGAIEKYLASQYNNISPNIKDNIQAVWEMIPDSEFGKEKSPVEEYDLLKKENDTLRFEIGQIKKSFETKSVEDNGARPVVVVEELSSLVDVGDSDDELLDKSKKHQTLILKNVKVDSKNVGSVLIEFFTSRNCCVSKLEYSLEKPFSIEFVVPKKNTWVMIQKIEKNAFIESYEELRLV